jgi:hypothetical protein
LQCYKSLWLYTHQPELREESEETRAIFKQGHEVGILAQELFPEGTLIPFEGVSFEQQLALTQQAIKKTKTIYEAAFSHDGVFVKADIIRKTPLGWNLYEVKSSNDVKDVYLDDVAVQYHIMKNSGLKLYKAFVVHLNRDYVRKGEVDVDELFTIVDVTSDVLELHADVPPEIKRQLAMLAKKSCPKIDIGPHCSDPYECDFITHCWQHIPKNSIFELSGRGVNKFELYEDGIIKIKDVPLERLSGNQLQQAKAARGLRTYVDKVALSQFLDELYYPLCFLDFETFMSAVPLYDDMKPYQQIPFQFSMHCIMKKGGAIQHKEFLAQPGTDPREELLNALTKSIPANACIVAYHKSFETSRLKELAALFPKHMKTINGWIEAMVDLIVPFRKRMLYSYKQKGSHSIKAVLPAFVKNMSYEDMEIADGGAAMEAYHEMCAVADSPKELKRIRTALLEYCKQDTLAMVKLLEVIEEKAKK